MGSMTLRNMCELLHISRRTIQGYEKVGLLASTGKNKYGHLLYDQNMVERAEQIRFFQKLGFKLNEIKDIIDAPNSIKRAALQKRVKMLEQEKYMVECYIEAAYKLIESL